MLIDLNFSMDFMYVSYGERQGDQTFACFSRSCVADKVHIRPDISIICRAFAHHTQIFSIQIRESNGHDDDGDDGGGVISAATIAMSLVARMQEEVNTTSCTIVQSTLLCSAMYCNLVQSCAM